MKNAILACSILFVSSFFAPSASAQCADESSIRSADSQNFAYSWWRGTATGNLSDRITIRNRAGGVIVSRTVEQWCYQRNLNGLPVVFAFEATSSGKFSVRFDYYWILCQYPGLTGGTITLERANGCRIDVDQLL